MPAALEYLQFRQVTRITEAPDFRMGQVRLLNALTPLFRLIGSMATAFVAFD